MMPNQEVESGRKACNWGMRYLGVIGQGKVVFIEDQREKIKALDLIMEKYAGKQKFGSISKYTIGIINRVRKQGIKIIFATARGASNKENKAYEY